MFLYFEARRQYINNTLFHYTLHYQRVENNINVYGEFFGEMNFVDFKN